MLTKLKESGRLNITILLLLMSTFSVALFILRYIVTDTRVFFFLNWNLFLAIIPWALSTYLVVRQINYKISIIALILVWIVFFPNSPYILTDLFHLKTSHSDALWFDLIIILSFAWTGLMFGFISLMDIHQMLSKYMKERWIYLLTIIFLFFSSFGIYLGRFLRWNSWDIVSKPLGLFEDIMDRFTDPMSHPRTWGMTILMGVLLNLMYFSLRLFNNNKAVSAIK